MLVKPTKTGDPKVDKALEEIRDELRRRVENTRQLTWASNDLFTTTADRYLVPGWDTVSTVERGLIPVITAGRLRKLTVNQVTAGTGTSTLTFVVRVNKKDTALSVSFPNTSTGVFVSKMNLDIPVKPGDEVGIVVRKSAVLGASSTAVIASLELVV